MGMTDADAISRSVAEPELFEVVFRRHHRAIHSYVTRRLGVEYADDVAAEVFAVAFKGRASYVPLTDDARPWLYGIATNLARRHRRAESRRLAALARVAAPELSEAAHERVPERMDAVREARSAVQALRAMPAGDREALLLLAWADLTYNEIAVALSLPVGTVRSRISRARRRVRACLAAGDARLSETLEEEANA
jgi:RNA polymerase sigma factor (sigma-70 family)